jgi:hypothetical protein
MARPHRTGLWPLLAGIALSLPTAVPAELSTQNLTVLTQAGLAGAAETGDRFGEVLATGDFDGNGFDDLIVGIPSEDVGALTDAGAVFVMYGSSSGLATGTDVLITADSPSIPGVAETGDLLGQALAVGDFNGDLHDDLAIGIPAEDVSGKVDAGAVLVISGSASGLDAGTAQLWTEDLLTPDENVWAFSRMGQALAAGDYDGDGRDDLAIGLPGDTTSDLAGSGSVVVLYGSVGGLTASGRSWFNTTGFGFAVANTAFGAALAAGEFLLDDDPIRDFDDLLVVAPGVDYGTTAGAAMVIEGGDSGLFVDLFNSRGLAPLTDEPTQASPAVAVGDTTGDGIVDSVAIGVPSHDAPVANAGAVMFLTYGSRTAVLLDELTSPQTSASLGMGLAIADFDGDGVDDLLAGAPGLGTVGEPAGSGGVFQLPGRPGVGPDVVDLQEWRLGDLGYGPSVGQDNLGAALVAGDFNGDAIMDAAFGLPGRDLGEHSEAGVVVVLTGESSMIFADGFESGNTTAW